MLSEHTPRMCYFGATEGDGSDFGVWPILDAEGMTVVDDCSKLASCGDNTAFVVNDHGNTSYYIKHGNRWVCEWSVV